MGKCKLGLLSSIGLALFSQPVSAEDFVFIRHGSPDRIFKQDEALVIELPESLSGSELDGMFIELDGIDVTQMVNIDGRHVIFTPATPYYAGGHSLRLVKMGKNRQLVELNRWRFTTSSTPPKESPTTVSGSIDATYTNIPWKDSNPDRNIPRNNLASQMQVQAATQANGWQFTARGNGFLNTEDDFNPAQENIEVGEYLLSAERPSEDVSTLLRLGNHDIGASNLLMDKYYRRGASAEFNIDQNHAIVTAFSQDPAPAIGNRNITGVGKSNQRASGIHTTFRPTESERLEVEGTIYKGEGTVSNSFTATGVTTTPISTTPVPLTYSHDEGSGSQVGLSAILVPDLITMRTQYAESKFDFDGVAGNPAEDDDAERASFVFTPLGKMVSDDGRLQRWTIETYYQRTGTFFDTLLNPTLEKDRNIYAVNSSYLIGGFTLDGEVSYRTDNANDLNNIPTNDALGTWVQTSYAPTEQMFGTPVFFFGGAINDEGRTETPAGYTGPDTDRLTGSVNGGVSMTFDNTVLSLSHTYTQLTDNVDSQNNFRTHYTDLTVEFRPLESVTLRPGVQIEYLDETRDGSSQAYHASLGADVVFVENKYWNTTNISVLLNNGATTVEDDYSLQSEFTWQLQQADINKPGYALALACVYDNAKDPITGLPTAEQDARVLLKLKVYAPFEFH